MYKIQHKFNVGDTVWTVEERDIVECIISQIVMEIDPINGQIHGIKTYHLDPVDDMDYRIFLKRESGVFGTKSEAIGYSPEVTVTVTPTLTVTPTTTATPANTPSFTPTFTPAPTVTPTNTITPTVTATVTPTISLTPTTSS